MRNIVNNKILKNKLILICFQFLFINYSFSQADINLKKYWVYRERLKNFMVSDIGTGTSIIAPKREIHLNDAKVLAWNDPAWYMAYWMGTLAMEYDLLSSNGENTTQTLIDLYNVIEAINRLDKKAEIAWGCSTTGVLNGFMVADDVPSVFPELINNGVKNEDRLNESLVPPPDGFRAKCIESEETLYLNDIPREMSIDHLSAFYIGFSLVKKYIPANLNAHTSFSDGETKFVKEIQNISNRIIDHFITNNWILTNTCANRCVYGVCNTKKPLSEHCFYKDTTDYTTSECGNASYISKCEKGGALAFLVAIGFLKAHEYINGGLTFQQSTHLVNFLNSSNRTIWNAALTVVEKDLLVFNLVTVGNIGKVNFTNIFPPSFTLENTKSVARRIKKVSIDEDWQHLIALHRLLHGNQYDNNTLIAIGNDYYECLLDAAPCRGCDGKNIIGQVSTEWGAVDRLNGDKSDGYNDMMASGVSYLFYFNLYNKINSNYLGNNYKIINIHELALENINKQNYTEYDIKNFEASNTITAQNNYQISIGSIYGGDKGRVTFTAGKKIDLLPGFYAHYGTFFNASINPMIKSFNCISAGVNFECEYYNNLYRNDLDDDTTLIEYDTLYVDLDTNNNPKTLLFDELINDSNSFNYNVYPNPNNGEFKLVKTHPNNCIITIYNSIGKLIYNNKVSLNEVTINIIGNPPGIYFLHLQNNFGAKTFKIIIE
jgi:hypothetical protein